MLVTVPRYSEQCCCSAPAPLPLYFNTVLYDCAYYVLGLLCTCMHNASVRSFALSIHWCVRENKSDAWRKGFADTVLLCELRRDSRVYYWRVRERSTEHVVARAKEGTGKVITNQWRNKNRAIISS